MAKQQKSYIPTPREFLMGYAWSFWLNNTLLLIFLILTGFQIFKLDNSVLITWLICNTILLTIPAIFVAFTKKEDSED